MRRIKRMKVISMTVIATLLFSSVRTVAADGTQEISKDSQSDIMEEVNETETIDLDLILSDSELSELPVINDEQAADFDAVGETEESTELEEEADNVDSEENSSDCIENPTEEITDEEDKDTQEEEENEEIGENEEGTEEIGENEEVGENEEETEENEEETEEIKEEDEIIEVGEEKEQEDKEEDEEFAIPAGVWSDREPFFTDDAPAESSSQFFRMARAADNCPTYQEAYQAMIGLQNQYPEGMTWTNFEPYGSKGDKGDSYRFRGGAIKGASLGVGCAAFAFILSDEAFGSLPSRTIDNGGFDYKDVKVGDILRVDNNSHFVIVLQVGAGGVVVAEGNYNKSVHWGRAMSVSDVMEAAFLVTRYPEGYSENDNVDETAYEGNEGSLHWTITNGGVLTISGTGDMLNYTTNGKPPWNSDNINTIIIENGVTSIGNYAFYGSKALTVYIPDGITSIGTGAFQGSGLMAVTIPSTTLEVGNDAFRDCVNLTSVSISEGVKTIGDSAFQACTALKYLDFPVSITSVGAGAFMSCSEITQIRFASGTGNVAIGEGAFTQCQKLCNLTLPQGLTKISNYMFQSCTSLAEIYIPASVNEVGEHPFTSSRIQKGGTIFFGGSKEKWVDIGGQFILISMSNTNVFYDVPFNDPFAFEPNDPGDLIRPDEGNDPGDDPGSDPGDNPDSNPGSNPEEDSGNTSSENNSDSSSSGNASSDSGSNNNRSISNSVTASIINSGINAVAETWKPTTPDEMKRYDCMGKEAIQYTQSKDNAYPVAIKNAIQGPMCFKSFEAVLGDYTIGRTYNIYSPSNTTYSTDKEVQITIKIPSAIYKKNRDYKMICVTKGGLPIVYNDLDNDPETITIKTNRFYAYALIYK